MAVNNELVERKINLILSDLEKLRNFHLITEQTLSPPTDYHGSFAQLEKLNILTGEEAARFAKLAGLRNRLSHEYNGIDEKIIHQVVKELVAELPVYIEAIKSFIDQE